MSLLTLKPLEEVMPLFDPGTLKTAINGYMFRIITRDF